MTTNPVPAPLQPPLSAIFLVMGSISGCQGLLYIRLMCPEQHQHDGDTVTQTVLMYSRNALDVRLGIHKNPCLLLRSQLHITAASKCPLGLDTKEYVHFLPPTDHARLGFFLRGCRNVT